MVHVPFDNDLLNFPVIESATTSITDLVVAGFALPGSVVEVFISDGTSPYGEGETFLFSETEGSVYDEDDGTGSYSDALNGSDTTNRFSFTVSQGSLPTTVSAGQQLTATATLGGQTSEFSPQPATVAPLLTLVKRAFQSDGTPIASGSTLPVRMPVKFMIYINNPGGAVADATLQDVLDPLFAYQTGSMRTDSTLLSNVVCPGGVCDEAAIFSQVDGSGIALGDGDADADTGSYSAGTRTIDLGDGDNSNNDQLDLATGRVWTVVFTIQMQ